jgi:glutamine amidotransferase
MITIIDIGMGNLGSMRNMVKRIGSSAVIESDPLKIASASKLILPGVGAFDAAINKINQKKGLRSVIEDKAGDNIPILGVCLGMQLLTDRSEEGNLPGLGLVSGEACLFPKNPKFKVPHMGWNICKARRPSPLTKGIEDQIRYYFVHSYYVKVEHSENSIMTTNYGLEFDSVIGKSNIFGVQFHPEKSHKFGMQLLKNFIEL